MLIPCCNEEATVGKVVADFRSSLPHATIYVYDNNSQDHTALEARAAGAELRHEELPGKGNVVRRMFADVEADFYFLVDGDDTYDAAAAPSMLRLLMSCHLDMVTAARVTQQQAAYRRGHRLGNMLLTALVRGVFGDRISDVLSGYRVFSRRFVKSFPALANGFEIETEFTVHALELHMPVGELPADYRVRPPGSHSKLHTLVDGLRILRTVLLLVKEGRPLRFFAATGILLLLIAMGLRNAGGDAVPGNRPGAAPAHRRIGHRPGVPGIADHGLRAGAGFGGTRPQGGEAAGLSRHSAATHLRWLNTSPVRRDRRTGRTTPTSSSWPWTGRRKRSRPFIPLSRNAV